LSRRHVAAIEEMRAAAANRNSQRDLGGDFADGAELQVRLAEVDSEARDLSRCQGVGELVHRSLRE